MKLAALLQASIFTMLPMSLAPFCFSKDFIFLRAQPHIAAADKRDDRFAVQQAVRFFALQKGGHRLRRGEEPNGVGNGHHIVIFGRNVRRQNRGGF